jgi:hypothetical protein
LTADEKTEGMLGVDGPAKLVKILNKCGSLFYKYSNEADYFVPAMNPRLLRLKR